MGEHVAASVPSQVANPWRAVWRTVLQVGVPAFVVLVAAGPEVLGIVVEEFGGQLPPAAAAWLAGAAGVITALAGVLTRVTAIPAVNRWLASFKLDAGAPAGLVRARD